MGKLGPSIRSLLPIVLALSPALLSLSHLSPHIRLTMLALAFPVLCVLRSQCLVSDIDVASA
jgi:hypothetical protein